MAYIPAAHSHYNLLPYHTAHGGEVFICPSTNRLEDVLRDYFSPPAELSPYGYHSYIEYLCMLDNLASSYSRFPDAVRTIKRFRSDFLDLNQKQKWSVCQYVGRNYGGITGLTCGQTYYWPCSASHPDFIGVIDNQELTNNWYSPNPKSWLIVADPTGMAAKAMLYYQETRFEKYQARLAG